MLQNMLLVTQSICCVSLFFKYTNYFITIEDKGFQLQIYEMNGITIHESMPWILFQLHYATQIVVLFIFMYFMMLC